MVLTLADGAIAGPKSIKFVEHESKVDGIAFSPLKEGLCVFHTSDNAAAACDKHFAEAGYHDRFLRLVRVHFAFGTGRVILRAVAREHRRIADAAIAESDRLTLSAAQAEAEGNLSKRDRCRPLATRKAAEALAVKRAGWDRWLPPLAPKEDSTRKVVWQSRARARIYDIFGLVYWGIRVRTLETREQACSAVKAQGRQPTAWTGMRTKK